MGKISFFFEFLKNYFKSIIIKKNTIIVTVPFFEKICFYIKLLKQSYQTQAVSLLDVFAIDHFARPYRFEIIYVLISIKFNVRFIVKIRVKTNQCVPTISSIFPSANWLEREVWDMFGIPFCNHKDLRRILTDYGFRGHPLRKDFPLTGFVEIRFNEEKKTITSEPIELTQEFRFFEFKSPWNTKI